MCSLSLDRTLIYILFTTIKKDMAFYRLQLAQNAERIPGVSRYSRGDGGNAVPDSDGLAGH